VETLFCHDQTPGAHVAAASLCWYGSLHTQFSEAHEDFCSRARPWLFPRQRPRSGTGTRTGAPLHIWYRISRTKRSLLLILVKRLAKGAFHGMWNFQLLQVACDHRRLRRCRSSLSSGSVRRAICGLISSPSAEVRCKRRVVDRNVRRYTIRVNSYGNGIR
jgi:hypothetical protein